MTSEACLTLAVLDMIHNNNNKVFISGHAHKSKMYNVQ